MVQPSADVCHRHVLTAQWRLWLCGNRDCFEHSKTPHRKCWSLLKFLCGEPILIILVTQLVKKLTNLYNQKFRTIVIPNSLALDSVLKHTNLQTVFFITGLVAIERTTQLRHSDGPILLPTTQCSFRRLKSTLHF